MVMSRKKLKATRKRGNEGEWELVRRPTGRLLVESSDESTQATKVLLEAGIRVVTLPVRGISEPELSIGADAYHGLKEIRQVVKKYKH